MDSRWTLQILLNIAPYAKVNPKVSIHVPKPHATGNVVGLTKLPSNPAKNDWNMSYDSRIVFTIIFCLITAKLVSIYYKISFSKRWYIEWKLARTEINMISTVNVYAAVLGLLNLLYRTLQKSFCNTHLLFCSKSEDRKEVTNTYCVFITLQAYKHKQLNFLSYFVSRGSSIRTLRNAIKVFFPQLNSIRHKTIEEVI